VHAQPRRWWKDNRDDLVAAVLSLPESCTLDVADRGGESQERVGELLGVTRVRTLQIEASGLARLREENGEELRRIDQDWERRHRWHPLGAYGDGEDGDADGCVT